MGRDHLRNRAVDGGILKYMFGKRVLRLHTGSNCLRMRLIGTIMWWWWRIVGFYNKKGTFGTA